MKPIIRSTAGALVAGIFAAGCSTGPSQSDRAAADAALGAADHAVSQAAGDPHVAKYASGELNRAQNSLTKARAAWDEEHNLQEASHFAYMAQQRARTAQEMASERAAEDAITVAAAERDHAVALADAARGSSVAVTMTGAGKQAVWGFATGKANLPAGSEAWLDQVAQMLKEHPDSRVVIEGHTDNVGSAAYNQNLAMERAQAVRVALYRRGIDPGRVIVRSSGEANPVASNDTRAGRRQNRRADVMIEAPQMARSSQPAPGATATGSSGQAGQTQQGGEDQLNEQKQLNDQNQQKQQDEQNEQNEQNEHHDQMPPGKDDGQ